MVKQSSGTISRRIDALETSVSLFNEASTISTSGGHCNQMPPAQGMQGYLSFFFLSFLALALLTLNVDESRANCFGINEGCYLPYYS